ncbi:MAG: hypothetical protein ACRD1K_06850 [Acidimicrobiales bacterium]
MGDNKPPAILFERRKVLEPGQRPHRERFAGVAEVSERPRRVPLPVERLGHHDADRSLRQPFEHLPVVEPRAAAEHSGDGLPMLGPGGDPGGLLIEERHELVDHLAAEPRPPARIGTQGNV